MLTFFNVLVFFGYTAMSAIFAGIHRYRNSNSTDLQGVRYVAPLLGMVWPAMILVYAGVWGWTQLVYLTDRTAVLVGATVNARKLEQQRTKMMDEDLQRFNRHQQLAERFDYKICDRCLGAGCGDCHQGLKRVRMS